MRFPSLRPRVIGVSRGHARRRAAGAATFALITAVALTACSSGGTPASSPSASSATASGCASSATPLTFWGWPAGYDLAVKEFNKTHPDICVKLQNAGAAGAEYTKLSDALTAKSGTPDVATIEYFELPSF